VVAQHLGAMPQTNPLVKSAVFDGNTITIQTNAKGKNCMEALKEAVNACVSVCRANSMVNCCEFCGSHDDLGIYSLAGRCTSICSTCFGKAQTDLSIAQQEIKETKSNVAAGIVGALLGSLIGVVLWVIVYQLGYIAGIVGFVMAICCMKGYEKFGGKLNLPGMIISLVIAVGMLYFAENISLALEIYNQFKAEFDITFFDAFQSIPQFMEESQISRAVFTDLAAGYLLMLVASTSSIVTTYQNANLKHEMKKIG